MPLAKLLSLDPSVIAHRISGNWDPATITFNELLSEHATILIIRNLIHFIWLMHWKMNAETLGDPDLNGRQNGNGMVSAGK